MPQVEVATPADRDQVVETVVAAFRTDPAFRFFFLDETTFDAYAAMFARYLFDQRVGLGTVWVVEGGASVAMWQPPGAPPTERQLDVDAAALARIDAYEAAAHTALPSSPYWYLGVLATHPDHAGKRWGRAVMRAGLDRAGADGLPAYLETSTQTNVELYGRAGWQVVDSVPVGPLTVHVMRNSSRS